MVLAGPGFGKTAFASSVCAAQGDAVLAVHLCRSDDDQSRDPVAIVKSLAVQLARSVPEFRAALASDLDALRATVSDPKASGRSLLGDLIVKPIRKLARSERGLVVIDGLDECERDGGANPLLDLLSGGLGRSLPPWLGVLVTSRPEDNVKKVLAAMPPTRCRVTHADGAESTDETRDEARDDIKRYLESRLAGRLRHVAGGGVVRKRLTRGDVHFLHASSRARRL